MSRVCRYCARTVLADYVRGLCGIVLASGLLFVVLPGTPLAWILAAALVLFLVYFGRAVVRHLTRIEWSERGIVARGPFGRAIPWDELRSLKLRHYTTRSDRTGGWMQLDLGTDHASIRIDSGLDCFAEIARAAAAVALHGGRSLDPSTVSNLQALGMPADRDG